mmetsp:Transcript_57300/g.91117  ORF Transcript_57300/g.91117 Transcript_57300/m.91117 type:complete len:173 (-) Transcript_57300:18-536(-)
MGCTMAPVQMPLYATATSVEIGYGILGTEAWERAGATASLLLPNGMTARHVPPPLVGWVTESSWQAMCDACRLSLDSKSTGDVLVQQMNDSFTGLSFTYSTRKYEKDMLNILKVDTCAKAAPAQPLQVIYVTVPPGAQSGDTFTTVNPCTNQQIQVQVPPNTFPGAFVMVKC